MGASPSSPAALEPVVASETSEERPTPKVVFAEEPREAVRETFARAVEASVAQHSESEAPEPPLAAVRVEPPPLDPPAATAPRPPLYYPGFHPDSLAFSRPSHVSPVPGAARTQRAGPGSAAAARTRVTANGPVPARSPSAAQSVLSQLVEASITRRPIKSPASTSPPSSTSSQPSPPPSAAQPLPFPPHFPPPALMIERQPSTPSPRCVAWASAESPSAADHPHGAALALALVDRLHATEARAREELAFRPGPSQAALKHEWMRRESEARHARMAARADRTKREEERAAAADAAAAKEVEERRVARLAGAREAERARMRLRASERDRAKAAALVKSLRKQVRAEQRALYAALYVQRCARRWLARCQVHRARGWKVQRQICAQQAAWCAKGLGEA